VAGLLSPEWPRKVYVILGQLEPGFRRNGRTFFIKMSYLFRKSFG
jgi:hypothetical protein